mmetsp:Transcript_3808/g.10828  ORF Transcript_3808/g.10828 Transcript_3808/m.10828 type:complete len:385 (+) Transcript_3808:267-1421(+)
MLQQLLNANGAAGSKKPQAAANGGSAEAEANAVQRLTAAVRGAIDSGTAATLAHKMPDFELQIDLLLESGDFDVKDVIDVASAVSDYIQAPCFGAFHCPICRWLYDWYLSTTDRRRWFAASFFPEVVVVFLTRSATKQTADLKALEALMVALYEEQVENAESCDLPRLSSPSVYHTPTRDSSQEGCCRAAQKSFPPGVAALIAGTDPSLQLGASLMPKTIQESLQAWQRSEVAAAALAECTRWMSDSKPDTILKACQVAYTLGVHMCPWAVEMASTLAGGAELEPLEPLLPAAASEGGQRVQLSGRLLEQLCLILGQCCYRVTKGAGKLSESDASRLVQAARTASFVLHARATADQDPQGLLVTMPLTHLVEAAAKKNAIVASS